MNAVVEYLLNRTQEAEIADHLTRCDANFVPRLSDRVVINDYAEKIASKAMRFEAWSGGVLVGLVAAYCNDQENRIAYITSVSVLNEYMGKGIAARLVKLCIEHAGGLGMRQISLEVARGNTPAIRLYEKMGFVMGKGSAASINMNLHLNHGDEHEQQA